jgi:hypothetical protein
MAFKKRRYLAKLTPVIVGAVFIFIALFAIQSNQTKSITKISAAGGYSFSNPSCTGIKIVNNNTQKVGYFRVDVFSNSQKVSSSSTFTFYNVLTNTYLSEKTIGFSPRLNRNASYNVVLTKDEVPLLSTTYSLNCAQHVFVDCSSVKLLNLSPILYHVKILIKGATVREFDFQGSPQNIPIHTYPHKNGDSYRVELTPSGGSMEVVQGTFTDCATATR